MGTLTAAALEPTAVKMPWRWPLFLLTIFIFATPLVPSRSAVDLSLDEAMQVSDKGNAQREIALSALGLFALVTFVSRKHWRLQVNGLLGWLTIFYIALAVASPIWAEESPLTIRRVGVLVLLFLGASAAVVRFSQVQTMTLAVYASSLTLLISVATEIGSGNFHPFDTGWRFSGMLHPVPQGWNCGLLTISALALAGLFPRRRARLIFLAVVAFVFLALTRSRMPLISTVLAVGSLGLLLSPKTRKLTVWVTYALLVCASLIWFTLFLMEGDLGRTARTFAAMGREEEAASTLGTFTGRQELWSEELNYARERPLLGYGYNAFLNATNLKTVTKAAGWVPESAHSGYIGTLLGLGYIGAITFILVLLLALKKSIRLAWCNPSAAFAAAIMVWICCNLFLESAIITDPTLPTFICFVVLASLAFFKDSADEFRAKAEFSN